MGTRWSGPLDSPAHDQRIATTYLFSCATLCGSRASSHGLLPMSRDFFRGQHLLTVCPFEAGSERRSAWRCGWSPREEVTESSQVASSESSRW